MNPNTPGKAGKQDGKPPFPHMMNEDDIGSGERTPGQLETDEIVRQVGQGGNTPPDPEARQVGTADDLPDELSTGLADSESLNTQQFGGGQMAGVGGDPARPHRRESIEAGSLIDDVNPIPPKGN